MGRKSVLEPIVMMQDPLWLGGAVVASSYISVKNIDRLKIEFNCTVNNLNQITLAVDTYDYFEKTNQYSIGAALDFGAPIFLDNTEDTAIIEIDCKALNTIQITLSAPAVLAGSEYDYKVAVFGKVEGS